MTVKDITPTPESIEARIDVAVMVAEDIRKLWPTWVEAAKKAGAGKLSSPHMLVALAIMSQAMMSMLYVQVSEATVSKSLDALFDYWTDPVLMGEISELREDKADILAFCDKILRAQTEQLSKLKAAN